MTTWSDPYLNGQGATLNDGLETVDIGKALSDFTAYMQRIASSIPFSFDVAAAFTKYFFSVYILFS